ncbi:MAG: hydrogenase maturation protease [Planctomycetes bacterium]|nr:hydrogenase maturation protease [Planctomycetota bacterium]
MSVNGALFVGIGSPHGDDRIGWLVADALEQKPSGLLRIRRAGNPLDLLNWLDDHDCLILCDACQGLSTGPNSDRCPPGTWQRWTWPCADLPVGRIRNSHDLGLVSTLTLAMQLNLLPTTVWLWGIEIADPGPERPLTPGVASAAAPVAAEIAQALSDHQLNSSGLRSAHA